MTSRARCLKAARAYLFLSCLTTSLSGLLFPFSCVHFHNLHGLFFCSCKINLLTDNLWWRTYLAWDCSSINMITPLFLHSSLLFISLIKPEKTSPPFFFFFNIVAKSISAQLLFILSKYPYISSHQDILYCTLPKVCSEDRIINFLRVFYSTCQGDISSSYILEALWNKCHLTEGWLPPLQTLLGKERRQKEK